MEDMEKTVRGDVAVTYLDFTKDVMEVMTKIRVDWGLVYPEEVNMKTF